MLLFTAILIYAFTAEIHSPVDLYEVNLRERLMPPSIFGFSDSGYLFGTDYLGRDIFSRLIYATRTSLTIAFVGLFLTAVLGITLGVLAAMCGGIVDDVVIFLVNIRASLPGLLIGLVAATIFGSGQNMLIILIALIQWTGFTRQVRGQIIKIKQENFIECSLAMGASKIRILFEHIMSNISSQLIITSTLNLSSIILLESTLSYLGLGIQPPDTSLGVMVSTGRNQLTNSWWLAVIPIIVIVIIVMCVSIIGDWLRDKLDPKLQNKS
ncbi:MAG: ABC transporter permease [Treponema sp.]|nr:ABC transporter permease [Treponema sp.]